MGFFDGYRELFDKIKESRRDKMVEEVHEGLRSLGVDGQIAEPVQYGKSVAEGFCWDSIGIIRVQKGPIRWVNILKQEIPRPGPGGPLVDYHILYGIPDHKLAPKPPKIEIESIHKKKGLSSKVVDLHWGGRASFFSPIGKLGSRIVARLNNDVAVRDKLIRSRDVKIRAYDKCWVISIEAGEPPSQEEWECYQAIAEHLLA